MDKKLASFPVALATAFAADACRRYASGDLTDAQFHKACERILNEDGRTSVLETLASQLPLPTAMPIAEEDAKLALLAKDMPGILSATASVRPGTHVGRLEADRHRREMLDENDIFASLSTSLLAVQRAFPIWTQLLNCPDVAVRLRATARITPTGTPLAILLPLLAGDPDKLVRAMARGTLGLQTKATPTSWRDYQRGILRVGDAIKRAGDPSAAPEERESHLLDPRPRVRYAAALALPPDSSKWLVISRDPSKRLRRLAAERIPLDALEVFKLARDEVQSVREPLVERLWAAFDAGDGPHPGVPRVTRHADEKRKGWKARLEAYFPEKLSEEACPACRGEGNRWGVRLKTEQSEEERIAQRCMTCGGSGKKSI